MTTHPVIIVHGLGDVAQAVVPGRPIDLVSGSGAALYLGCGWWRAMVAEARSRWPVLIGIDILDCADDASRAVEAIGIGQQRLVLSAKSPGYRAVLAIAEGSGATVFPDRPEALELRAWLRRSR
ncbi:MAG: hypothetical protein JO227_23070 [Acetobacteraceae bacterium]|nr:hypothetical protein [Acetobacteraceae bacterium]